MAVSTIVATAGSATANAFVTQAVATQFHLDHPQFGTTAAKGLWSAATSDEKDAAILWATKLLDRFFIWEGSVVDTIQKLLWPRSGLMDVNGWESLDTTTIPDQIQWATAELARQLLMSDRTLDSDIETLGLKLVKAGPIRLDFKEYGVHAKPIPDAVANLIPRDWGYLRTDGERELLRA